MLGNELRARGHGTFFRSLGAVLGYLPPKGSLKGKSNQNNYTFQKKIKGKSSAGLTRICSLAGYVWMMD